MLEWTICLDAAGEKPLYEQLYDSLSAQIRGGTLQAGDRLVRRGGLGGEGGRKGVQVVEGLQVEAGGGNGHAQACQGQ